MVEDACDDDEGRPKKRLCSEVDIDGAAVDDVEKEAKGEVKEEVNSEVKEEVKEEKKAKEEREYQEYLKLPFEKQMEIRRKELE